MGDISVDIFLETLKQLITSSNLDFPIDTKDQLQSLEKEIKDLRKFLKITEKKRKEHPEVMKLVMQIRDVVSEAENIVELFIVLVFKADHTSDSLREHQDHLEGVKEKIKTLTDEVKHICEGKHICEENMYDLSGITVKKPKHSSTKSEGGSSSSGGRNTSKVVEEKTLVGIEDEVKTLLGKLHDSEEGKQLEIISIIGVGGGGKTTLAKEVYDHPLTLQKFDIRAWASVSQDYNKTMKWNLLISILESASQEKNKDYGESSEDELGEKLCKCLKGRKYLIVMDDIWDIEAWNDIQRSFPKECKGSKVLLTSRLRIQPDSVPCVPHFLDPLPKSCSWELLQKKVFGKNQCPSELVHIGKQIAEKCDGLPLAIVAIAGILATEDKTLNVWEKVAKNLSSIIAKNQEGCMEILELSYNHLPLHLKACFLYIGGHPEDSEIRVRELIWLWIAEGFIQQSDEGKSLEAIAQDYLIGLTERNLVMVAKKSKSHGGIKACHIHDLLRELCLNKAEEDNFLVQNDGDDSFSSSATNKHRRLFVGRHFFRKLLPRPRARNIRSFLFLSLPNSPHLSLKQDGSYAVDPEPHSRRDMNLSFFVENFELLRVLHLLSVTSLGEIGIGDLVHLRYLALTLPKGECFRAPNCFHYLSNLETLNLQVALLDQISLPRDIVKMVKLKHLYTKKGIFEYHHVSNYDEEVGNMLDSLQTLHRMCACKHCLRLLERTPNLRKLGLSFRKFDRPSILWDLEFLKYLEILYVDGVGFRLHRLRLPPTLTRLTLYYTFIEWEELSIILQTLPSLEVLKLLCRACVGQVWNTSDLEEGFSQLKYLRLEDLDIEEWNASEDQFPRLEALVIEACEKLKRIPIDFANLNSLREIDISYSRPSLDESAREIQEKQRNTKGDDDCVNTTFYSKTDVDESLGAMSRVRKSGVAEMEPPCV